MITIAVEAVEALAASLEQEGDAARDKLTRLIRAHARIIAQREPHLFRRRSTEYADENGHWDNSYPPKQVYRARTGPKLICVRDNVTKDVATSGGFYYEWKRITEDQGLYVSRDGQIYGCEETGTGRVGQFAAHPGDCGVEVTLEWDTRSESDLTLAELQEVEADLRAIAFPASVQAVG